MPTYEYECVPNGHRFERFQRFSDAPVQECEVCGAPVRRVLFPPPVIFKGPGFYKTDYGKKPAEGAASGESKEAKPEAAPEAKTEAKATSEAGSSE